MHLVLALVGSAGLVVTGTTDPLTSTAPSGSTVDTTVDTTVGGSGTVADAASAVSPLEILNGLLVTPFPVGDVGNGFDEATIEPWIDANDSDLVGAVAGVTVELNSPSANDDEVEGEDDSNAAFVSYIVYPDDSDTTRLVTAIAQESETTPIEIEGPDGSPRLVLGGAGPGVVCAEARGVVLVGAAVNGSGTADDLMERSCGILDVAVDHLDAATAAGAGFAAVPPPSEPLSAIDQLNLLVTVGVPSVDLPSGSISGTALVPYGSPGTVEAAGAVTATIDDGDVAGLTFVVQLDRDAAERWVAGNDLYATTLTATATDRGGDSQRVTFEPTTGEPAGCAESVDNIVVVAVGADSDTACAYVAAGVEAVLMLGAPGT